MKSFLLTSAIMVLASSAAFGQPTPPPLTFVQPVPRSPFRPCRTTSAQPVHTAAPWTACGAQTARLRCSASRLPGNFRPPANSMRPAWTHWASAPLLSSAFGLSPTCRSPRPTLSAGLRCGNSVELARSRFLFGQYRWCLGREHAVRHPTIPTEPWLAAKRSAQPGDDHCHGSAPGRTRLPLSVSQVAAWRPRRCAGALVRLAGAVGFRSAMEASWRPVSGRASRLAHGGDSDTQTPWTLPRFRVNRARSWRCGPAWSPNGMATDRDRPDVRARRAVPAPAPRRAASALPMRRRRPRNDGNELPR